MHTRGALAITLAVASCAGRCLAVGADHATLAAGFAAPPSEARPLVWWHWINGNVTKRGIRADLEDMRRAGIGGAQLLDVSIYLPPGPVRYGSDAWHEHVQYAIRTAAELGLELDLMNCPGWSASGGPWNTPERSMKQYVWSETEVEGGRPGPFALAQPPSRLGFYRDTAVLAIPSGTGAPSPAAAKSASPLKDILPVALDPNAAPIPRERVLDLTASMNPAGELRGELPAGRWTVLRFGHTTTGSKNHPAVPEGHGLECDKLDAEAVAFQFEKSLGRILREAGPQCGKALAGVLFDSFEAGEQNWTGRMPARFQRVKGYDLTPWLPVLAGRTVGSRTESEAFQRDFRGAVRAIIAEEYFGTMQRLAHEHGLKVYAEAEGGPVDPALCNAFTDVPMNEFWMPDAAPRVPKLKLIASIASLLGRRVVGAEAFTAKPEDGRWLATPATLKRPGDCAFTGGINRFIFHTYVHQPFDGIAPGFTLGRYGTHFGRQNTWWPFAGEWIAYLSRCQFLLQQGRTAADVFFLNTEETGYLLSAKALEVPPGYDFIVGYPRDLAKVTWKDGVFRHPIGPAWRVLVMPERWNADLATLRCLKAFVDAGAPVLGGQPESPAGLRDIQTGWDEWRSLVKELWGGRIQPRASLEAALAKAAGGPDCVTASAEAPFIHRVTDEGDIYFISNQSDKPLAVDACFRAGRRAPELWDPITGRTADAPAYAAKDGRVSIPLRLAASGSVFVVFRRPLAVDATVAAPAPPNPAAPIAVKGPWRVRFQGGRGAPEEIAFERLISWTQHPDPGVRHFSGVGAYTTAFLLPPEVAGHRCLLELGNVADVAEVTLNGRRAGVAWAPPFELDATGLLRPGSNTLEIAVANRWINRLIGDEALPPDARYRTDGSIFTQGGLLELPAWLNDPKALAQRRRFTFATWHFYEKDSPLVDSGLLGPVTVRIIPP